MPSQATPDRADTVKIFLDGVLEGIPSPRPPSLNAC